MSDLPQHNWSFESFAFPSTRYSGSKRRLLPWLRKYFEDLVFDSVLDAFGGTGSVSLLFKLQGKKVHFNDLLKANQIIGLALIENPGVTVSESDLEEILSPDDEEYPDFIANEFKGIYFTDVENIWLDRTISKIRLIDNQYQRALLMASLFQACLAKRPFNLFHRANLNIRLAEVERSFGNKTTWERSFPELMRRFLSEFNLAVFSNGKSNKVIGGYDALLAPNGVDLVYLDPPYYSKGNSGTSAKGTNYLEFYHFLEGLADYTGWPERINGSAKTKAIPDFDGIQNFTHRDRIYTSFENLFERFAGSIIVLSYRDDGIPSRNEIVEMLSGCGKTTTVFEVPYRYALSKAITNELLFIAQ